MMESPPTSRRLAAILAADIVGYSALVSADEEGTVRALKGNQAEVLPLVAQYGGRVIDTAGDGIMAEFGSVLAALNCALAIQATMAQRNASVPPTKCLQYRMGINLGDVIFDDARIYGDGINIAARLEGLAEPGGICVSENVHDECFRKVECAFEDMGRCSLKNIERAVQVYRVRRKAASQYSSPPGHLSEILQSQLARGVFSSSSDIPDWITDAQKRMKTVLLTKDRQPIHPILPGTRIRLASDAFCGLCHPEAIRLLKQIRGLPLTVACPSSWLAPISVLIETNNVLRSALGGNVFDIKVDSTIGIELAGQIEKNGSGPQLVVLADGAIRAEITPRLAKDYEYVMPLFRDAVALLRRKTDRGRTPRLSAAYFCANSAVQECMLIRDIPGVSDEGKYAFHRASEAKQLINQIDHDKGLFESAIVGRHYVLRSGEFYIDDEFNSYHYVSLYCRKDAGLNSDQKNALANVVAAHWVALQTAGIRDASLSRLWKLDGLVDSVARASVGFAESL